MAKTKGGKVAMGATTSDFPIVPSAKPSGAVKRPLLGATKTRVAARPTVTKAPIVHKTTTTTTRVTSTVTSSSTVIAKALDKKTRLGRPAVVQELHEEEDEEEDSSLGSQPAVEETKGVDARPLKTGEAGWEDLDAEDAEDPLMVSEYVNDIFEHMFSIESKSMPNPNYIDTQHEIKWPMRAILVDWLIDVHAKFALLPETLFLAINIVDRFLSLRVVSLAKLQLVGITAMFVAAKYEEIMAPSVTAFIYMSDGGYSVEEVLKAERYLMGVLEFDLSFPNPLNFLRRISKADDYDLATRTVSKYLMEIPLLDHRFLQYRPSQIAAAAMWFSRRMLSRGPWGPNLVHYSGYAEDELMPIVHLLHESLRQKEIKYESLYKKYTHKRFMKASVFCREWAEKRPKAQDL